MKANIINYIRAGYPGLYIVSGEHQRVEAELKAIGAQLSHHVLSWSITEGLIDTHSHHHTAANDPLELLDAINDIKDPSIILLRDFHLYLADPNPILVAKLKDALTAGKTKGVTILILGCRLCLPPELEREVTVVEYALPDRDQLDKVLDGILDSADVSATSSERDSILNAVSGLTCMEAENCFALSVVEAKKVDAMIVAREKAQTLKKGGLLEIIEAKEDLDSIGGLDLLKAWLLKRRNAFSEAAREYGLPTVKGLLILGIAGTGKSICAKATAKCFGIPLVKLDAGRIFAGLVGQSEANLRSVMQTAEAIAPCCLWIDELDKAFAGSKSSGSTDGGTSARVFGSFLSWMQEKVAPVFVVATANDVTQLPPEFLRKGRWDELFFVDLPKEQERKSIWEIVIKKHQRNPKDYDLAQLARITEGLTGSEIEQVFVEGLYVAFDAKTEPGDLTLAEVLNETVPLSKLMAEQITHLRTWAKGRARHATTQPTDKGTRRLAA